MKLNFKYRIYPDSRQEQRLSRTLTLCRELHNMALEQRHYQRVGKFEQMRQLTQLRRTFPEYQEVNASVLHNVLQRLDRSFIAFFRRCQSGLNPGYPRFKNAQRFNSFELREYSFRIDGNRLRLSHVGMVKIRLSRPLEGVKRTCTIKRDGDHWYACIVCEVEAKPLPASAEAIGIDVGIENLAAMSDGSFIANPKFYEQERKRLRVAQRRVARRKRGSNRRHKAVATLRAVHAKILNRRRDYLHKQTTALVRRYGLIAIEDLNVAGLAKGILAQQVQDASWAIFFEMLTYKAESAGRELIKVDRRYTSQTCPGCGAIKRKSLSEREHRCDCGYTTHRDTAAAQIILARTEPSGANLEDVTRMNCLKNPKSRNVNPSRPLDSTIAEPLPREEPAK